MSHIEVIYGGHTYTVVRRTFDDVQRQLEQIVTSSGGGWLEAHDGHGAGSLVRLLVSSGVPLALAFVPDDPVETDDGAIETDAGAATDFDDAAFDL
ncbi:hypothetical protein ACFUTX_12320 [Microbacterium sp. NPDC057407]|uniref:hypothetical protein n=1 Tax=Microbacterium sp. NPDC057407 TaxID=3346120 RepID=UPI00366D0235